MKVLQIVSSFAPGGAEVFVKELSKELCKQAEVEVWALTDVKDVDMQMVPFQEAFQEELREHNIKTQILNKRPNKDRFLIWKTLRGKVKQTKPDLIHTHLEQVTFHAVCALIGLNIPVIQTIHNTKISYAKLQKLFIENRISYFIAISQKVKQILINEIGIKPEKISIIYNGINLSKFNYGLRRQFNDTVNSIISIGRLEEQKNHLMLMEAYKLLSERLLVNNKTIPRLKIVGRGAKENELRSAANNFRIDQYVDFLGTRNDIPELLAESDIYIMSSKWEGLSISLIEALASGIPIIATNVGSNSEIVENGVSGVLVEPNNPEILADAMYDLICKPETRYKYSKAAQKAAIKFDIENTADEHIELYTSVLLKNSNSINNIN
jgi:glycosyltransferase involved in cell wall biosynthesis